MRPPDYSRPPVERLAVYPAPEPVCRANREAATRGRAVSTPAGRCTTWPADPDRVYAPVDRVVRTAGPALRRGRRTWQPAGNQFVYDGEAGTHQWLTAGCIHRSQPGRGSSGGELERARGAAQPSLRVLPAGRVLHAEAGTRSSVTFRTRPFIRFFACKEDLSRDLLRTGEPGATGGPPGRQATR